MSTAVILAGGKSSRMGTDKLRLIYDGRTLLEGAVARFTAVFDRVYVSVGNAEKYADIGAEFVVDEYPGCGPMAGLHAALKKTPDDGIFLTAADLPFSDPLAAMKIIELCGDNDAAFLLSAEGRPEPTFGYYRKTLLPAVNSALQAGNYRMKNILENASVREITPSELGSLWREDMLDNINYPDDYRRITGRDI